MAVTTLKVFSWWADTLDSSGSEENIVNTYDTKRNHYLCNTIDNILLCAGSCTTRTKRSVSRIWDSSPKLSVRRTWEHEGRKHTHEYINVSCVWHTVLADWPVWKVCKPPWRWSLKGWPSHRTQTTGEFPWLPHFGSDCKKFIFCYVW